MNHPQIIDATNLKLGRLASDLAFKLQGKDQPTWRPNTNSNVILVIVNCQDINLTEKQLGKSRYTYTGYLGNLKEKKTGDIPRNKLVEAAVKGMLPKNKLSHKLIKQLHCYLDDKHPYAQTK